MEVLKVSSKSNANAVAGALAGCMREHGTAELQGIGAGSVNVIVKAIAIARGFLAPGGTDMVAIPAFVDLRIGDDERTAMKFICSDRMHRPVPRDAGLPEKK